MKGMKLTAGILVATMMITSLPVEALASKSAESDTYITGTSISFAAGATAAINEVYKEYFTSEFPARSFVEVARLPKDVLLEIEAIATK